MHGVVVFDIKYILDKGTFLVNTYCSNHPDGASDKTLPLMLEVWGLNPEPIISPTRYQRIATAATLKCEPCMAQSRGDGHRSLVTPERVLSEY